LAIVIEMVFGADKSIQNSDVYRSIVRNHAKPAYDRVAAWLKGSSDIPSEIAAVDGLAESANQMT
jgi:exoribonuclease R